MEKPETVFSGFKNKVVYELTLNPQQQHENSPLRPIHCRAGVRTLLKERLHPYANYYLYGEISEPRRTSKYEQFPRIHYHGIVIFHDVVGFLLYGHYKLQNATSYCFSDFRLTIWQHYCEKQQSLISHTLKIIATDKWLSIIERSEHPPQVPKKNEGKVSVRAQRVFPDEHEANAEFKL